MAVTVSAFRLGATPYARLSPAHLAMVAAALIGGGLTFRLLSTADQRTEVAVLRHAVRAGEQVQTSDLRWVSIRIDDNDASSVVRKTELADLKGRVTRHAVSEDSFLARSDLIPKATKASGLAAMSVPLDRGHAVGGELRVGDRVDVLAEASTDGRVATNLEVIGVDDGDGGPLGRSGDTIIVTLALARNEAVALATALRAGDVDMIKTTGLGEAAPLPSIASPSEMGDIGSENADSDAQSEESAS